MEQPTIHPKWIRMFFFWCGILSTFSYRAIVVLNFYGKFWVQLAWYVGTIGFIIYFAHRYQISEKRAKLIQQHNLEEKVKNLQELSTDDKEAMEYIFTTLHSSKEKWNNIFLFVASGIALLIGIYLDFLSPYFGG